MSIKKHNNRLNAFFLLWLEDMRSFIFITLLCLWTWFAFWWAGKTGQLRSKIFHYSAQHECQLVKGADGPEDVIHLGDGIFIASSTQRKPQVGRELFTQNGGVFVWDAKSGVSSGLRRLKITPSNSVLNEPIGADGLSVSFDTHGMSVFKGKTNNVHTLFVINHARKQDSVEVFELLNPTNPTQMELKHLRTIRDPLLTHMNDVQAISETEFYATNDCPYGGIDAILLLQTGAITFYNGTGANRVASGLRLANGIHLDHQNPNYLYAAALLDQKVFVYQRNTKDNSLTFSHSIHIYSGADNLEVNPIDGSLWVGCHPALLGFLAHLRNGVVGPSEAIRIDQSVLYAKNQEESDRLSIDGVTLKFADDGHHFSASSTATPFQFGKVEGFVLGQVVEDGIYYCSKPIAN